MKFRRFFISNSSSSSFIIALKPSEPCPHCGRSDANLIDLIKAEADRDYSDTRYRGDKQYVIEELEASIKDYENEIKNTSKRNKNEKYSSWSNCTVGDYLKGMQKTLKEEKELLEHIKKYENVHEVSISYHSELLNILKQQEKSGTIQVLQRN